MTRKRLAIVILILIIICTLLTACNGKLKGDVVIKVEGEKVHENMFRFFCNLLLNQDEGLASSVYIEEMTIDEVKEAGLNFAKEYYFRLNEAKAAGIKLTSEEIDDLETQFEKDYESYKESDGKEMSKKEFYEYYYGLTEEQYREFWLNWSIVEKYTVAIEKEIVVTEDMQKSAYDTYYDYICTYNLTMLTLDIKDMTSAKAEEEYQLALEIKNAIDAGNDFANYVDKYCDDKTLVESKGDIDYYPYFQYSYPEVHQKVIGLIPGEVAVAKTDDTIYVFRLESIDEYDELANSDTLKEWAIVYQSNKMIEELVKSDKYSFEVNEDVYKECDISSVVTDAMIYWQSIWAGEA